MEGYPQDILCKNWMEIKSTKVNTWGKNIFKWLVLNYTVADTIFYFLGGRARNSLFLDAPHVNYSALSNTTSVSRQIP